MTCTPMTVRYLFEYRFLFETTVLCYWTPSIEIAAFRRIERARNIALHNDTTASFSDLKENLKLCLIYNVIMVVFALATDGLFAVAPLLGIVVAIIGLVLSVKLLMEWFDLTFLGVIWLSLVAFFVLIASLVVISSFLIGVLIM